MIRFACACGRQLQAKDEDAGKKAKCPQCGAILMVAADERAAPALPPAPVPEERDDTEELPREEGVQIDRPMRVLDEEDRPRSSRRSRDRDDPGDRPRRRKDRGDEAPQKNSGKATAALVFGISSVCLIVTAIPGLIFGMLALRDISKSDSELGGRGAAITGIVFSCLSFVILMPIGIAVALLMPAVVKVRGAAERMQDANNLKQVGLAMHIYSDAMGRLPQSAAYQDANGKPLLSWRVAILPYIEHQALYRSFKLDEPWDSPHNIALLPMMPKTYALPKDPNPGSGMTYYQVFVGPGSAFEPRKQNQPPAGKGIPNAALGWRLPDFTDGTSNTILVATARNPVPWTKPEDLTFDPNGPIPPLGGHMPSGYNIVLGDGSIRFISNNLDDPTLRALITRNGGEPVTLP